MVSWEKSLIKRDGQKKKDVQSNKLKEANDTLKFLNSTF
jgi:hypothetical protein